MTTVRPAASVILVRADGAVLWVRRGEQLKFAAWVWLAMAGGVVLLAYLMLPFPR